MRTKPRQSLQFARLVGLYRCLRRMQNRQLLLMLVGGVFGYVLTTTHYKLMQYRDATLSGADRMTTCRTPEPPAGDGERKTSSDMNGTLLIGVMTAQQYVATRAWTVWRTWAQQVIGQVVFFVAERTVVADEQRQMPIVRLKGVNDNTYPPQKKAFMMLAWMADYGLPRGVQWFIRADDDVYMRPERLQKFLASIDHNRPYMIGQSGFGAKHEIGLLSLARDENYCMGGPGVVFSREAMRRLRPHLAACLQNMYTTHEDTELGRCVRRSVGIDCTWNYQMRDIFHQSYDGLSSYSGNIDVTTVHQAITLHPVKSPATMIRLHSLFLRSKARRIRRSRSEMIRSVTRFRNKPYRSISYQQFSVSPERHAEIPIWDFLTSKLVYCTTEKYCPKHGIESNHKQTTQDVLTEVVNDLSDEGLKLKSFNYAYRRISPIDGGEYILDLTLRRGNKEIRKHVHALQRYAAPRFILDEAWGQKVAGLSNHESKVEATASPKSGIGGVSNHESTPTIHMIVPLSGRPDTLRRFAANFRSVCLSSDPVLSVSLTVVLFRSEDELENNEIVVMLEELVDAKHPTNTVKWIDRGSEPFSRAVALSAGSASVTDDPALLFFLDVDVLFTKDTLYRLLANTVLGVQVFFPIMFNEYAPETWLREDNQLDTRFQYGRSRGFFRDVSYGMVGIYKQDLVSVGGLDESRRGWGGEDDALFRRCLRSSSLRLLRAPEPALVHVYHPKSCDSLKIGTKRQLQSCAGSRAAIYGSVVSLAGVLEEQLKEGRVVD